MSNVKRMAPLTGWVEYELAENEILDPPRIRLRLKPLDPMVYGDVETRRLSAILKEAVIEAIRDWDLTDDGKPIPCNEEAKLELRPTLECLLGTSLKGQPGRLLGLELLGYAGDKGNFLGNSSASSAGGSTGQSPTA